MQVQRFDGGPDPVGLLLDQSPVADRVDRLRRHQLQTIGRLEFDAFCDLILQMLSSCDMPALPGAPNGAIVDEICARHGVIANQGELRGARRPVPFFMLFDRDAAARGY